MGRQVRLSVAALRYCRDCIVFLRVKLTRETDHSHNIPKQAQGISRPFLWGNSPAKRQRVGVHRSLPVDDERAAARGKPMVKPTLSLLALAAQAARRAAPRLRKAPIELTDAAAERVRELLGKRDKVTLLPPMPPAPPPHNHHEHPQPPLCVSVGLPTDITSRCFLQSTAFVLCRTTCG